MPELGPYPVAGAYSVPSDFLAEFRNCFAAGKKGKNERKGREWRGGKKEVDRKGERNAK